MSVNDDKAKEGGRPLVALLLVSALWGLFGFILMPFSVYLNNAADFPLIVKDHLLVYGLLGGCTLALLVFAALFCCSLCSSRALAALTALFFGGALAFYAQGNLIGVNYGLLDGTPIDWAGMRGVWWVNTAVWLLLLAVPVVIAFRQGRRAFRWISLSAGGLLAFSVLVTSYCVSAAPSHLVRPALFTLDNMMEFSKTRNVVVLVADSFDRGLFDFVLAKKPSWKDRLAGMTYYHNTSGCFLGTDMALPQLITGAADYRGEGDGAAFKRRAYAKAPLLGAAGARSCEVDLYADVSVGPTAEEASRLGVFGNALLNGVGLWSREDLSASRELMSVSLFRYLPHALKERYWNRLFAEPKVPRPVDAEDGVSYQEVEDALVTAVESGTVRTVERPKLKFYHIKSVHAPRFNPEWAERTLDLFCRLREKVAAAGLGDRTAFVLMADHGYVNRQRPVFLMENGGKEFVRTERPFSYRHLAEALTGAMDGSGIPPPLAGENERDLFIPDNCHTRSASFSGIGSEFSGDGLELLAVSEGFRMEPEEDGVSRLVWRRSSGNLSISLEPSFLPATAVIQLTTRSAEDAQIWLKDIEFSLFGRKAESWLSEKDARVVEIKVERPESAAIRPVWHVSLVRRGGGTGPLAIEKVAVKNP